VTRVRVDPAVESTDYGGHDGAGCEGCPPPYRFFEFSSKNAGFYQGRSQKFVFLGGINF